jgi:hypothetical protein
MKVAIAGLRTREPGLKLEPGDEVVVIGRMLVKSVGREVVDVTGMSAEVMPEVVLGELELDLVPQTLEVMLAGIATPRTLVELARQAGIEHER